MSDHSELDNPFWSSLVSVHQPLALRSGDAARYPPEYAPFFGVAEAKASVAAALDTLIAPGESVYLLGIAPRPPARWQLEAFHPLAQMVCEEPIPVIDGPEMIELSERHRADVLALTRLVYPHYFRERTMEMGRYFGIYQQGRLAAMIGERLAAASVTSLSVMPPTAARSTRTRMSSLPSLESEPTIASTDPCASALTTTGYSCACFSLSAENIDSRLVGAAVVRFLSSTEERYSATSRARASFSTTES